MENACVVGFERVLELPASGASGPSLGKHRRGARGWWLGLGSERAAGRRGVILIEARTLNQSALDAPATPVPRPAAAGRPPPTPVGPPPRPPPPPAAAPRTVRATTGVGFPYVPAMDPGPPRAPARQVLGRWKPGGRVAAPSPVRPPGPCRKKETKRCVDNHQVNHPPGLPLARFGSLDYVEHRVGGLAASSRLDRDDSALEPEGQPSPRDDRWRGLASPEHGCSPPPCRREPWCSLRKSDS